MATRPQPRLGHVLQVRRSFAIISAACRNSPDSRSGTRAGAINRNARAGELSHLLTIVLRLYAS
jgi:hypothetical protein